MKKNAIIIGVFALFFSCTEPKATKSIYLISNQSKHMIEIVEYYINVTDTLTIDNNTQKEYVFSDKAGDIRFPLTGDSVVVYFNDTISIIHNRDENHGASRSILLKENWEGGVVNEFEFEFNYTFTEDDYLEAK